MNSDPGLVHRYLNINEAIQHFHRNPYQLAKNVAFVEDGEYLSDQELVGKDISKYGYDYGLAKDGSVNTIYLKEKRYQDNLLKIIISNYGDYPFEKDYSLPYNCDSLAPVLELIFDSDQQVNNHRVDWMVDNHALNRARTFSILTHCDPEALNKYNKKERVGLFLAIQHSDKEIQSFYYPLIVTAVRDSIFKKGHLALVTDRLLLGYGYSQVFGSQVSKESGDAENLMFPDQLDELREQMGLGPINEYLDGFNERAKVRN